MCKMSAVRVAPPAVKVAPPARGWSRLTTMTWIWEWKYPSICVCTSQTHGPGHMSTYLGTLYSTCFPTYIGRTYGTSSLFPPLRIGLPNASPSWE